MILQKLQEQKLISVPKWLPTNCCYLTIMGSMAYGISTDSSDIDYYGFAIPPKEHIWPTNEIPGFGRQTQRFEQYQQHGIKALDGKKVYDITVYNIIKYFQLLMDNNPSIVDSIFTPSECVVFSSKIGELVRENRKLFLHKGLFFKYKGYAFSQAHKMSSIERTGKRKELYDQFKFDVKFAMNLVRLLNECEQLLTTGDLDLRLNNEQHKAIRRGDWTETQVREYFTVKEAQLEKLYHDTNILPYSPDEEKLKKLLFECLELHYGSIAQARLDIDPVVKLLEIADSISELKGLLERYYADNRPITTVDGAVER